MSVILRKKGERKLNYCFIVPSLYINQEYFGRQSDFLLALAHMFDDELYEKEVVKWKEFSKKPLYLDNGMFEGAMVSHQKLTALAIKYSVDLVFCPDVMYNPKETRRLSEIFINYANQAGYKGAFAYIPQADNIVDYLEEIRWANENKNIKMIGINHLCPQKIFGMECEEARIQLFSLLEDEKNMKPCHLLGLGSSLNALDEACLYPFIVSHDSSSAWMTGINLKTYNSRCEIPGGKIKESINFNQALIKSDQMSFVRKNIKRIQSL